TSGSVLLFPAAAGRTRVCFRRQAAVARPCLGRCRFRVHRGPWGALAMTVGVFLPAFSFTLLFYRHLETVIANPQLRHFLEGVTAGVVGLIAITSIKLGLVAIPGWKSALVFAAVLPV